MELKQVAIAVQVGQYICTDTKIARPCIMCGNRTMIVESSNIKHGDTGKIIEDHDVLVCLNRGFPIRDEEGNITSRRPKVGECGFAINWSAYKMEANKHGIDFREPN